MADKTTTPNGSTYSVSDLRRQLASTIETRHYTRSIPSGKSWWYEHESAIVVFSIPPNKNISTWLLGEPNLVLELSRLWAPDGHEPNLLTRAISKAVREIRRDAPAYQALISYADPNVDHTGGVYRAASWVFLGQCEEGRYYRSVDGQVVSRRKFHSGSRALRKDEIEALGYRELRLPGKLRFAKGLSRSARKQIARRAA